MKLRSVFLLIFSLAVSGILHAQYEVMVWVPESLFKYPEIRLAVDDFENLIAQANGGNKPYSPKTIRLSLSLEKNPQTQQAPKPYPVIRTEEHSYHWTTDNTNGVLVHRLTSPSPFGLACGLYGLLQEALGFAFYHPKQTYIPDLTRSWPLDENFTMDVQPKFQKKGFHLHTMHPIELAESLFNPQLPNALEEVKSYIDWLARNEQNVFDFCLLESIDKKTWIDHARAFTEYAHQRGILTSVDVSLHMIQQKSFQLYQSPPHSFRSKKQQIRKNLDWLFTAHWDIINMEFNSAEFITGNAEKRNQLRKFVQDETEKRGAKLMGRQHVVQESNDLMKSKTDGAQHTPVDSGRGVLAHTVMFYSMTEPHAPVYENENQRHVFEFMKRENKIRETWYYPESAYWVTFDNSVPVYPLPYLSSRLADIDTAAAYDVEGHITFSSGWEMGYWMFDWSIARWCKHVSINGRKVVNVPTQYFSGELFSENSKTIMDSLLILHETYLKGHNLMAFMTAQTVTDEVPDAVRKEFHPRPPFTYGWLRNKSEKQIRDSVQSIIILLRELAEKNNLLTDKLSGNIESEFKNILYITGLRALHRAYILEYLCAVSSSKNDANGIKPDDQLLEKAAETRIKASGLMNNLRSFYRYDPFLTDGKYEPGTAYTSYDFGYLYTARTLHFWQREEEQAKKNRYDFLFKNIWNVFRIVGIAD